ncbi:MAG: 4-(cytidine 5'-diphospho)-2-C-methyl-D-erythritol kinase [Candidatus Cloacimonetes bacterium]|nr:4-(cytidine 5'-diphospho)-2-C-methyl-D-erythritol kinase [Candidatus Cloacimonadota bacterium]
MEKAIKCKSYAKINLFLEILRKRKDEYSEIQTIFSLIDVYDRLNFVLTKNSHVKILTDTDCLQEEDNLVYKVAVFIKKKYNVKSGVIVDLEKNIPISAGLGGGSSNAASTILALNILWDLRLSENQLHEIAALWGSDINFFLKGATALGEARGEKISSLPYLEFDNIFLVNPGIGIASSEAYKLAEISTEKQDYQNFLIRKDPRLCFNRLEPGIRKKYSEIDDIIRDLELKGAIKAILSGSGATVIGFCPNKATANKLSQYYTNKGYWNTITKTKGEPNEHYRC